MGLQRRGLAALSVASIAPVRIPPRQAAAAKKSRPIRRREALAVPVWVGGVAAASQYGTVAFLPLFAMHSWGLSPVTAAIVVTVARILSVPAKLVSGNAADSASALRIARWLGVMLAVLGAWWTIVPGPAAAAWAAVFFVAFVSGLGPFANVPALESFEERAELLGVFRSAQIGLDAATGAVLGVGSEFVGLRPVLAAAAFVIPASLLLAGRAAQTGEKSWTIPK